jgi:hypothetical protein
MKFPRTWKDVESAPWCYDTECYLGGDGVFIHIEMAWLPPNHEVYNSCTAWGETLAHALQDLHSDLWPWMRDPSTGKPVSRNPKEWGS